MKRWVKSVGNDGGDWSQRCEGHSCKNRDACPAVGKKKRSVLIFLSFRYETTSICFKASSSSLLPAKENRNSFPEQQLIDSSRIKLLFICSLWLVASNSSFLTTAFNLNPRFSQSLLTLCKQMLKQWFEFFPRRAYTVNITLFFFFLTLNELWTQYTNSFVASCLWHFLWQAAHQD